jgi:hypothetical protein
MPTATLTPSIPASAQCHGKFGRVWVSGTYIHGSSWDATFEADHDDTTSFESQGWGEFSFGIFRGSGSIELIARTDEEIYAAGVNVVPGTYLAAALFDRALHYYAGTMGVISVNPRVAVNGAVKFAVRWMTNGVWVFPVSGSMGDPTLGS